VPVASWSAVGSSTTRCRSVTRAELDTGGHELDAVLVVELDGSRSASTEEGDSTSDSEIDARPPRIAYNASGVDQWAFGQ
jgi:hypothetical protein